jgi:hypothetical protein
MNRSRQFGVNILVTVYHEERLSAKPPDILQEEIAPEAEVSFDAVQLGDLAKPI